MSSATRDPEVKRLGDPDWDFSRPQSLTGSPVNIWKKAPQPPKNCYKRFSIDSVRF